MEKVWYYPDGTKWAHFIWNDAGEFNDTIYQCARTFWHPNGQLFVEENWLNGERHGKCRMFHKDGTPITESHYQNGKYHNEAGPALTYFHCLSGEIHVEQFYINGRQLTKEKWEQTK